MNIDRVSKEISCATTDWIVKHPNGGRFTTLNDTFYPLLNELVKSCEWAVTGVKTGNSRYFIPQVKDEENEFKFLVSSLINSMSNRGFIVSTIDFCTDLYTQNITLLLWANSQEQEINEYNLNICVKEFLSELKSQLNDFQEIINYFDETKLDNKNALETLKNQLESKLKTFTCPQLLSDNFTKKQCKDFSSLEFKLYLALVTLIEPTWIRIAMLPSIAPAGHLHHPGGLVICETEDKSIIDTDTLQEIRKISSIPFLPWMLTARTTERGDDQYLAPTLIEFEKGISNDYRNIEYLMGGKKYTLTNKSLFKLKHNDSRNSEKRKSLSSIVNYLGVKEVIDSLKSNNFASVEYEKDPLDESSEKIIIALNEPTEEIVKGLQISEPDFDDAYYIWAKEQRQRTANVKGNHSEDVCNGVSIVVPIASSEERVDNFLVALNSYDDQTVLREFPDIFELIVLIDSNAEDIAFRKKQIDKIIGHIDSLPYLQLIDIKIYYSSHTKSIGRSSIRNFGIKQSTRSIIQLFDDSIILQKNYLEEVLIRFEHLKGQKIAIVGFKERLYSNNPDFFRELMNSEVFIPDARDDFKRKETASTKILYPFRTIQANDNVDYMSLTGDLCFMTGSQLIGKRNLKQFFSTANVSFLKSEFIATGGFHPRFDEDWGMEDGFLGMLLTANGTKIIPCYSALALDLKHRKDLTKRKMKEDGEEPWNRKVEIFLNNKPISYFNETLFNKSIDKVKNKFCPKPYDLNYRPNEEGK